MLCLRLDKGPPIKVAYEHIRLGPDGELAVELMERNLDHELTTIEINDDIFDREGDTEKDDTSGVDISKDMEEKNSTDMVAWRATLDKQMKEESSKNIGTDEAVGPT